MKLTTPQGRFGLGEKDSANPHFNGPVWIHEILGFDYPMLADTVTFAPGVRNNWHRHAAGQVLFVTDGEGWYQEQGKPAQRLIAGDVVKIPAGVWHWHGAAKDSYFTHLALEDWSKGEPTWGDPVCDADYDQLP